MTRRHRVSRIGLLLAVAVTTPAVAPAGEPAGGPAVPVALVWGSDGLVRVALREARQVALVDVGRRACLGRLDLPFRPASIAPGIDGSSLLVGGQDGELLSIQPGGRLTLLRPTTGRGTTRALSLGGGLVAVASVWDPYLRLLDEVTGAERGAFPLPFPPGLMVRRSASRFIVADAFGDRLADIDLQTGKARTRFLDGVNLHALALSGDRKELLIGHVVQTRDVPVTASNIDAGLVLSSRLTSVRLSEFDGEPRGNAPLPRRRVTLDGPVHGAADPSGIAVSSDGSTVYLTLSGAHQIMKNVRTAATPSADAPDLLPIGHNQRLETLAVGRNPVAVALDPSGTLAVTADAMSDTLTVVRTADMTVAGTVRLGPESPARTPEQRGEAAFRDGGLAMDRWMSCASCHPAGHTSGLNFDTSGDGGYGASKNTPSLLGVGPTRPYAWTGAFATLSAQVHQSFQNSLRGPSPGADAVADVSAYLRSLAPPAPALSSDDPSTGRGAAVFQSKRCDTCHAPPHYTSLGTREVGLDDGPGGHRAFNAPSLRGVGWSSPYFHDGRAATLDAVLDAHHPRGGPILGPERRDLIAFLKSL